MQQHLWKMWNRNTDVVVCALLPVLSLVDFSCADACVFGAIKTPKY